VNEGQLMLRISRMQAEVMAATDLKLVPASKQAKLPGISEMEESKNESKRQGNFPTRK
jgi:hypothetical protein